MLAYMVRTVPADRLPTARSGALGSASHALASSDNDLRQAALYLAQELAADMGALRLMQQVAESLGVVAMWYCPLGQGCWLERDLETRWV